MKKIVKRYLNMLEESTIIIEASKIDEKELERFNYFDRRIILKEVINSGIDACNGVGMLFMLLRTVTNATLDETFFNDNRTFLFNKAYTLSNNIKTLAIQAKKNGLLDEYKKLVFALAKLNYQSTFISMKYEDIVKKIDDIVNPTMIESTKVEVQNVCDAWAKAASVYQCGGLATYDENILHRNFIKTIIEDFEEATDVVDDTLELVLGISPMEHDHLENNFFCLLSDTTGNKLLNTFSLDDAIANLECAQAFYTDKYEDEISEAGKITILESVEMLKLLRGQDSEYDKLVEKLRQIQQESDSLKNSNILFHRPSKSVVVNTDSETFLKMRIDRNVQNDFTSVSEKLSYTVAEMKKYYYKRCGQGFAIAIVGLIIQNILISWQYSPSLIGLLQSLALIGSVYLETHGLGCIFESASISSRLLDVKKAQLEYENTHHL